MVFLRACKSLTTWPLVNCCIFRLSMNNVTYDLLTWHSFSMTSRRHSWHSSSNCSSLIVNGTIFNCFPILVADNSLLNTIWWNDSWTNNKDCLFIPFNSNGECIEFAITFSVYISGTPRICWANKMMRSYYNILIRSYVNFDKILSKVDKKS